MDLLVAEASPILENSGEQRYRQTHIASSKKHSLASTLHSQVILWHHVTLLHCEIILKCTLRSPSLERASLFLGAHSWS